MPFHVPGRRRFVLVVTALLCLLPLTSPEANAGERLDKKAVQRLAKAFFEARPWTKFEAWDPAVRSGLLRQAAEVSLPDGATEEAVELLWKAARKAAPKLRKTELDTPYGRKAEWNQNGRGGAKSGLLIGLHGGGEGAGSASEAQGSWSMKGVLSMYPQGILLVGDNWNAVTGEAFVLTLIELAKVRHEIDPDRVYVAGFSMGGTGSFHMVGRHPDLFAAAIPAHGVVMAAPRSKVASLEEIEAIQYGLLPNMRNVAVYFYTGTLDRNCEPYTFQYAWDLLQQLEESDPGGYQDIRFQAHEGVAHAQPPGEPGHAYKFVEDKRRQRFPEKLVWEYAAHPQPLPGPKEKVARVQKHWFYWLHCRRPADAMQVTAVREGNTFDLELSGRAFPDDFTIYLNPEMIDVAQDVVVRVDGVEVYRGRPKPEFAVVLESLDAKMDRRMVFDRRVRIPEPE